LGWMGGEGVTDDQCESGAVSDAALGEETRKMMKAAIHNFGRREEKTPGPDLGEGGVNNAGGEAVQRFQWRGGGER